MLSIVGAGLFAAWFVGYFQPILNKNQEMAKLNIEELALKTKIQEDKNTIEKNDLYKISVLLSEENSKIKNELEALINQNKILENDQKNVAILSENLRKELEKAKDKYLELSKKINLTLSERERFAELVKQSDERILSLNQEIKQLQEAKEATVNRTNELTEKRDNYLTFGGNPLTFGGKPLTFGGKKNPSGNE
jgi:DNA repair exonuclease SbcCD ATPase subunit